MDERLQAEICVRIQQARVEAGFTQEEAADLLGVTQRAYFNYEHSRVPFRLLTQVAEMFGVSERWLLRGEEEPQAADAGRLREIDRRLELLEGQVAALATRDDLRRGLDALRAAIDAQANPGTRRARRAG